MNRKTVYLLGSAVSVLTVHGGASASDTVTYTYDALGRLIAVSTSGGPNNGQAVSTAYDPCREPDQSFGFADRPAATVATAIAPPRRRHRRRPRRRRRRRLATSHRWRTTIRAG